MRESNGRPFSVRDPDLIIFYDASLSGWGASLNDASAKGSWADQDRLRHINELELMVAFIRIKIIYKHGVSGIGEAHDG